MCQQNKKFKDPVVVVMFVSVVLLVITLLFRTQIQWAVGWISEYFRYILVSGLVLAAITWWAMQSKFIEQAQARGDMLFTVLGVGLIAIIAIVAFKWWQASVDQLMNGLK